MKYARRIGATLALVGLLGLSLPSVAFANFAAQGGQLGSGADRMKFTVTTASGAISTSTIPVGTVILGFKINTTSTAASCGLYDAATLSGATNTTLIDELYENTTSTSDVQIWPKPYKIGTQLTVVQTSAVCTIYYE